MKYAIAIAAGLATIAAAAVYVYTRDDAEPTPTAEPQTEATSEEAAEPVVDEPAVDTAA